MTMIFCMSLIPVSCMPLLPRAFLCLNHMLVFVSVSIHCNALSVLAIIQTLCTVKERLTLARSVEHSVQGGFSGFSTPNWRPLVRSFRQAAPESRSSVSPIPLMNSAIVFAFIGINLWTGLATHYTVHTPLSTRLMMLPTVTLGLQRE